jgi:amino acid adenylation domain-containing protein
MFPVSQALRAPHPLCLSQLLEMQARRIPNALAILAPGRAPLTYSGLWQQVDDLGKILHAMGLNRHDRLALVLPNGPEMAVAFLGVAVGATCAPLNPAYSADDFDFYLTSLRAKALILQAGMDSPARAVARTHDIRIFELSPRLEAEAGCFKLTSDVQPGALYHGYAQPDDVGLVLYTTGTTSRPKKVPLTHANLCISAHNTRVALALVEDDRCLNVMPLFHTHGLGALLASLLAGASMVCTPDFSAPTFFDWMAAFSPTWYTAVPTIHQAVLARAAEHYETITRCPLRFVRSGSAACPPQVLTELERVFHAPVIEYYGMTEAASQITCNPLPPNVRKPGSVGVAVGSELAIMDQRGMLLPVGASGEIVIRGANVMQGYDDDPMATQSAFTHGWFWTGDEGFLDHEGYLFITGRRKEIINRGGEKIAPLEVDAVLMEHPAVAQAVTFAVPDIRLGEEVAAAVVLRPNTVATDSNIRQFAASRLASWKVPRQVLIVEGLPKSPSGKLQRLGLAERLGLMSFEAVQSAKPSNYTAPRTPVEEMLVGVWTHLLNVGRLGIYDDFFTLGGDSILAMQLIARVREAMHIEFSFLSFFEAPTVAGMARSIETASQTTQGHSVLPLQCMPRDGPLLASYAQQRLWFLEQLGLSRHAYHLLEVRRLHGPLQVTTLTQSLQEITRRHEVLRTTFVTIEGRPHQVIGPAASLPLPVVELRELPEDEREAQVHVLALEEATRPFNLAEGPLIRATLIRLADEEHVLLLTMHHIVSDGWSHGVFWHELAALYEAFASGKPSPLPELSIQYVDFAHWQQQWLQGEVWDTQLAYWKRQLAGVSMMQLPTDRPRPVVQTFQGTRHPLKLSLSLTQALKALSRAHGVTLFMTLLAAFQTLLHRYTGQNDIAVGSVIANRNLAEIEGLIGLFANTLVLRADLSGDPKFRELLEQVREVALGAYGHQDLPFEKLLEELRPLRDLSRTPLFQVMFILHNTPRQPQELAGLIVSPLEVDTRTAKFDVMLDLWETSEGLRGWFEYSTDLFDAATIARMAGHLQTLLEGVVANPEQRLSTLPLLTVDERRRLLVKWNATTMAYPDDQCIHHLFEAQVERTPDTIAVIYGAEHLSYHELNRRANQVAHYLRMLGVGPEVLVGLCMERSLALVVGLLGILKAGGVYVPFDPSYPPERLAFMLEDAPMPVCVTQERYVGRLPAHGAQAVCLDTHWRTIAQQSDQNPVGGVTAENAAYVLYTSGSTGRPKGIVGTHRALVNVFAWMWQTYPFAPQEMYCQKASISYVDALEELLEPLLQGRQTVLIPDAVLQDLPAFVRALAVHRVTRLFVVPSLLRAVLDVCEELACRLPDLTLYVVAGEVLSGALTQCFLERMPYSRLLHRYGASEVTSDVTWYDTHAGAPEVANVPIGRPMTNVQLYLLDRYLQPVPVGVPGELHVGGASLSRGYLNRPELTAEQFIPHPFSAEPGARLYKTGDLACYLPDGNIAYLGRLDQQVKLRGMRIELGEIEAALGQHPLVRKTVMVARQDVLGELRLVAYLVPTQEQTPTITELRRWLRRTLPDHMIPATFVWLAVMPLTPNGKIDSRSLPAPDLARPDLEEPFVAPRTPIEQQVAAIWCRLLDLEEVGLHDNFFELGGHSLLAVQLMSRLHAATHVEISLLSFFETPTVLGIASLITAARRTEQSPPAPAIVPMPRECPLPASVSQEQLWTVHQVLPDVPGFHISHALRLLGTLNVKALERSCHEIVRRHEALRTTFDLIDGQLVQVIAPILHVPLAVADLRVLPETERVGAAIRAAAAEAQQPFDLAQGPLLRFSLLRLGEEEYRLLLTIHHIISDGWSMGVLTAELLLLYEAFAAEEPSPLPELSIQYADFAYWQRQWRHSAAMQAQLVYWQEQLRAPLAMLELPTDRPREAALSFHAAHQDLVVPSALSEALKHLSQREGSTLFMTLVAACKMLLYCYTGQEDLRLATLVANRTRQETEALIGLLVNTVILRTDLSGNPTCREVLQRVRVTTLEAYAHQDLPFEELISVLEHERQLERRSLCQVMLILQNATLRPAQPTTSVPRLLQVDQSLVLPDMTLTTFDIVFVVRDGPQGLAVSCIYRTAPFDAVTMRRWLAEFQQVLTCFVAQPEQPLVTLRATLSRGEPLS